MKIWSTLVIIAAFAVLTALHLTERKRHQREMNSLRDGLAALSNTTGAQHRQTLAAATALTSALVISGQSSQVAAPAERSGTPQEEQEVEDGAAPAPPRELQAPKGVGEMHEALEATFQSQSVDPWWSRDAERTVRDRVVTALQSSSALLAIECKASLCRFETQHERREQYNQFFGKAFIDPETRPWNGAFFSTRIPSSDGRIHVVSYLVRDGVEMPAFSEGGAEAHRVSK